MGLNQGQQIAALTNAGVTNPLEFSSKIGENPALKALLDGISKENSLAQKDEAALLTALAKEWKAHPDILGKMNADLQNPETAQEIKKAITDNPGGFASTLPKYKDVPVNKFLAAIPPPPASSAAPASETKETEPRPTSGPTPPNPEDDRKALEALAAASNDDLKRIDPTITKAIVRGLAASAKDRFGVNPAMTNGFAQRVESDPVLLERITENFRRNPNFVRELAKAGLDKTSPREPFLTPARAAMTNLMANPHKLADDVYVKNMEARMKMATAMKEGNYKQLFSGIGGGFSAMAEQIGSIFAGFQGKSVLSMGNGGGFLPHVLFDVNAFYGNMASYKAFSRNSPEDMIAFPIKGKDGQFFHQEPVLDKKGQPIKGADGNPVTQKVPNTIEIRVATGEKVKVIPSQGDLMAIQRAGSYIGGKYVPGTYEVVVVTGIDDKGRSAKLDRIDMTPEQFADYKKQMEKLSGRPYPEQPYTEQTHQEVLAQKQQMAQAVEQNIVKMDPKTGQVQMSPEVAAHFARPQRVVPPGTPDDPANAPEFHKRA